MRKIASLIASLLVASVVGNGHKVEAELKLAA